MLVFQPLRQRLRAATSPIEERPWHSGKAFPLRQRLPSVGELSSEARLRGLLKYKKIRQQTSFLLGRMLPYPWCHLNYRHSVPVTLCALPVESTAAITSGARLPLLPAAPQHPGVQGEAHGGSFRPGHLRGSHLPALSGRGRLGLTFPVQRFSCENCITAFSPCQPLRSNFYRFVQPARPEPRLRRSCGTYHTKRCPRIAG